MILLALKHKLFQKKYYLSLEVISQLDRKSTAGGRRSRLQIYQSSEEDRPLESVGQIYGIPWYNVCIALHYGFSSNY